MAKKISFVRKTNNERPASPLSVPVASTPVRNTPIPRDPAVKREIPFEMIRQRAYEIWQRNGGDAVANWHQAERELRSS